MNTGVRRGLLLAVIVASVLAVAMTVVRGRDAEPGYVDQLRTICHDSYETMTKTSGTYFENVVTVSSLKHQGLSRLAPPDEHARLHRELVRWEWTMFEKARLAQDRVAQALGVSGVAGSNVEAEFRALRAAQAELDRWYRSVGVENCSD